MPIGEGDKGSPYGTSKRNVLEDKVKKTDIIIQGRGRAQKKKGALS